MNYLRKMKGVDNPSQQQIHDAVTYLRQKRQQQQQAQQAQQNSQQPQPPLNAPSVSANRTNPPISAHPQHPPPIAIPSNTVTPPQPPGPPLPAPMIQSTFKAALDQSIRMSWKDLPQHLHLFQPESEGKALQVGLMKGMMGLGRVGGGRAVPPAAATVATAAAVVNGGVSDERKAGGGGSMEVSDRVKDLLSEKGSSKSGKKKDRDRDREKSRKDKRNKEDKKRRSNDISSPSPPPAAVLSTSDSQQEAKRPKLMSSASSKSLASVSSALPPLPPAQPPLPPAPSVTELSASHESWKRSTEGMMEQMRLMREGRTATLEDMRRKKEETERLMREREEDEVKIREMRRAVEEERRRFEDERRARKQQDDEEDALMRAVWKQEEWYMDMNVMRRKIMQLLQRHEALRVDEERVVELVTLGCQQYVKGVVEEMMRVKSRRREEEKERWRREGRVVEGADVLEEVKRRERLRAVEVERRLKEREKQRRRRLAEAGVIDEEDAAMEEKDGKADGMNRPTAPPPPPAPSRSKADDANKLTVADLVFVMERDGRLKRSERMWTVYGRLGLRMKDWPKEWQPAQSIQSKYVDVSAYNLSQTASSSFPFSTSVAVASDTGLAPETDEAAPTVTESSLLSPTFSESATGAVANDALLSPFSPAAPSPTTGVVDGDAVMQDESSSQQSFSLSQPSRQSSVTSLASSASASASPFPASFPVTSSQPTPSTPLSFDLQPNSHPSASSSSPLSTLSSSPPAAQLSAASDEGGGGVDEDFEAEVLRHFNE